MIPHEKGVVKPGIRVKFVGILMLAALLPLVVAAIAVHVLGNRYYRESSGQVFHNRAEQMANYLIFSVTGYSESLHDRLALVDFFHRIEVINRTREQRSQLQVRAEIEAMERQWADLAPDAPEIRELTENPLARDLLQFKAVSPLFAEIFVTDNAGRLVATTNKTTTYWHAFKPWWQLGMQKPFKEAYIEGVNFDRSAGVYSFDIVIPIRNWRDPEGAPAGVAKAVLHASPLLFDLAATIHDEVEWKVVLEDGAILFGPMPLEERITEGARETLLQVGSGWMLRIIDPGQEVRMVGFTQLPWLSRLPMELPNPNLSELWDPARWQAEQRIFILIHANAAEILAPVRNQLLLITAAGVPFVLACFLVGIYLAQYHILQPIKLLQAAARNIASSAKLARVSSTPLVLPASHIDPDTRTLLNRIVNFNSEDELGELSRDFSSMAQRVLSYHAHLESEITMRVAEMQGDLMIAREFQEALMPRDYPQVPSIAPPGSLILEFNHIYKPASTVGGDFFNVIKLSENQAGIFIADVMGHGSRSALITAIVATLLHDLAPKMGDPADFMAELNRHFHHLIQHSRQVIFVTAFYLVIDTRARTALFASAGHPPPLLVQRKRGVIKPLINAMQNDTALGLLEESTYACFSRPISEDDMFLLFTDGLFEAINPLGEEFGIQRLMDVVTRNMSASASEIGRNVLDTVERYSEFEAQADDICLMTVEVNPSPNSPAQTAASRNRDRQFRPPPG
jgi:phosphoserine phosphatase RsbU/P